MHFEAKKHAYRQTQDGVVVSFVVHPNDVCADLAIAPLGTHYVVALAPYTEQGPPSSTGLEHGASIPAVGGSNPPADTTPAPKERRPFHTLPRSQQAGIACDDPAFRAWVDKQPWKTEAARLHADEVWDRERNPNKWFGVFVCDRCGVSSRRWLDAEPAAADRWDALYNEFLVATGQTTWERPA